MRVEGESYFVKGQDGKEVRLHTGKTTEKTGAIDQGDRIESMVKEENRALSIRSARDRRAEPWGGVAPRLGVPKGCAPFGGGFYKGAGPLL